MLYFQHSLRPITQSPLIRWSDIPIIPKASFANTNTLSTINDKPNRSTYVAHVAHAAHAWMRSTKPSHESSPNHNIRLLTLRTSDPSDFWPFPHTSDWKSSVSNWLNVRVWVLDPPHETNCVNCSLIYWHKVILTQLENSFNRRFQLCVFLFNFVWLSLQYFMSKLPLDGEFDVNNGI